MLLFTGLIWFQSNPNWLCIGAIFVLLNSMPSAVVNPQYMTALKKWIPPSRCAPVRRIWEVCRCAFHCFTVYQRFNVPSSSCAISLKLCICALVKWDGWESRTSSLGIFSFTPPFLSLVCASVLFCCIKWPYIAECTPIRRNVYHEMNLKIFPHTA